MRIFLLFFVIVNFLFAQNSEIKLYSKLFSDLFGKKIIYIYSENKKYRNLNSILLRSVNNCKKADVVIGVSKRCKNKPHFLLDYYNYQDDKNAIGALYWRKGRPQLRLRKDVIKKYHLHLTPEFEEFAE